MNTHELKCVQPYYNAVAGGSKMYEVRFADRDYQVGDVLILKEWVDERVTGGSITGYTGNSVARVITHILEDFIGLQPGYVILGLKRTNMLAAQLDPPTILASDPLTTEDQIKARELFEAGHVAEAQRVILGAIEGALKNGG